MNIASQGIQFRQTPLRRKLDQTISDMRDLPRGRGERAPNLADLTVLAAINDPYRFDTIAGHRNAKWFCDQIERVYPNGSTFHLRGCHYLLLGLPRPDSGVYENNDKCWVWLQGKAADAARWLGYVPFDRFRDGRNDEPKIVEPEELPRVFCSTGGAEVPSIRDIKIRARISGSFSGVQPWQIAIFGEKSSLLEPLEYFHDRYQAGLYVGAGELSDTLIYSMAKRAAKDGRPLAVFCLSDFDPSGWQMPISIARKLDALSTLCFPKLRARVIHVGLNASQAIQFSLPSTPLKETELRSDKWKTVWGREQTEVDAFLSQHPNELQAILEEAIRPYFDDTLERRVSQARHQWEGDTQRWLDAVTADEAEPHYETARNAAAALEDLRDAIEELDRIADRTDPYLPPLIIPDADIPEPGDANALWSTEWSYFDRTKRLKAQKAYELDGEDGEAA
jgi:hypothetical protein